MFLLLLTRSDEIIIDLFLISDDKKLLDISSFVVEELAKKTFLIFNQNNSQWPTIWPVYLAQKRIK